MLPCPQLLRSHDVLTAWPSACPGCGQTARRIPTLRLSQQRLIDSCVTQAADRKCGAAAVTAAAPGPGAAHASGRRPSPPSALTASAASTVAIPPPAGSEQPSRGGAARSLRVGQRRWKGRADDGSAVSMFDAALEHGAVKHCLYQAQRMLADFDEQRLAQQPRQLQLASPASRAFAQRAGSARISSSAAARQHLFDTLRGRHQRFLRTCLAGEQLPLALDYIRLLPRNDQLFTAFLKEAVMFCSLDQMHEILKVGGPMLSLVAFCTDRPPAGLTCDCRCRQPVASFSVFAEGRHANSRLPLPPGALSHGPGRRPILVVGADGCGGESRRR